MGRLAVGEIVILPEGPLNVSNVQIVSEFADLACIESESCINSQYCVFIQDLP